VKDSKELLGLEKRLLDPAIRRDAAALEALPANEFKEVGASGREYNRHEIIAALLNEPMAQVELHDFVVLLQTGDVAVVTYRTIRREEKLVAEALRSSVWLHRGGRWQMYFHQGTRISEEEYWTSHWMG